MQIRAIPMDALSELVMLQLEKGGRAQLTVTGYSMRPMLRNRKDTVELVPVDGHRKPGDIILYRRENGQYVLHRIIALDGDGYICSGDNQAMREPVKDAQLLAVVDAFTRKGKRYTLDAPAYRVYTWLCVKCFFLRKYYIAFRRLAGRLLHKFKRSCSTQGGNNHG